ncbi:major facilitator superfamily domain-containing protein [Dactylonectria macrodidyma]|uniref:Major facilitator superfamily domain-containing protein n=1 Tax=Dactylonectria macrodidyma TaxID=307937 RepID=A0A9P9IZ35_9HYPO|nr:major facilitator superfamily domain-containing protein [Dactylonectria macrodidyma]
MVFTYIFNYIDKVALSEASIFGIKEDLNLVGQQYSWSYSIFYLGYLVWQYPSSLLMQKLPIGRYFGVMIFLWGLTATTTPFTTGFATLSINRVFLGVFETCMSPILTILVSQYWTRDEQPLRTSLWWSASAIGAFIADAITYGVSGKEHTGGKYSVWQVIYLVFGPLTLLWGVIIFFGVPSSPLTAWFLNKRERKIATARVMENHTSIKNTEYKWEQVRECLTDPQPWILALHAFLQCLQGGGLTSFSKIVLTETLGYTSRQATLMSMPSNTIHLVSVVFAHFKNTRLYVMMSMNVIVLIGAVLVGNLPQSNQSGRLASFYIIYVNTVPFGLGMSMISSNIAGFTKKSTASVMMFLGYCLGQFTGPQFFIETETPHYQTAFRGFYSSVSAMILLEILLLLGDSDLTDCQQPSFRKTTRDADLPQPSSPQQLSPQEGTQSEQDDPQMLRSSSLSLLDTATMPWMDGVFDSYLDQQWDLTSDPAVLWNVTANTMTINDFPDQTRTLDANSSAQVLADFSIPILDQQSPNSSSPSAISDRVLAQHYTQNLTSKYSSKEQGWNNHTYFFNRFNSSHPFVISSLYAWTAAHLFCNGTIDSQANAMGHYDKSLVGLGNQLGIDLLSATATGEADQTWFAPLAHDDDLDAVSVALYFLAWTDLLLSRRVSLRRILNLEALLLEHRGHDQSHSVYVRMAVWFCFLDARAALFCQGNDRIIQAMGDDAGLIRAVGKSHDFLQIEYSLLYPKEERRRDEAHMPLGDGGRSGENCEADVRASMDDVKRDLEIISETRAAENKVLSIYLTTSALFHAVEIYASRIFQPNELMYSGSNHAEEIIAITRRFYQKLKRPRTEAPPTKIWPVPLIMAAIEARDPVYRDWALQQIRDYSRTGKHFVNACSFVEKHIIVEGTPYERGLTHGRQASEKVRANIEYYKLPGKLPDWSISSKIINTVYLPAFEKFYPTGLEEIRGIADGAGVTVEEVIMLNARYDLGRCMYRLKDGGKTPQQLDGHDECTSGFFAPDAVASGHTLAVHNWDMSTHLYNQDLIIYLEVHPDPSEGRPCMFILTEAGQLIRSGMNAAGMSVTANSLLSSEDYVPVSHVDQNGVFREVKSPKPVLPLSVARRVFLEYSNYAEGLVAINAFPRHVSGNLHVSTADGFALAMEVAPDRVYKFYGNIDDRYLIHSNHFLSPEFLSRDDVFDRYPGGSSWFRAWQAEKGVRADSVAGRLTPQRITAAFSDHLSFPESLCNHPNLKQRNTPSAVLTGYTSKQNMTVAFVIYNLSERTVTVCKGPPCDGVLQEFCLKERSKLEV